MKTLKTRKETAKALLLETEDGRTFWIQKRWMRDDGSLTPKGQEAMDRAQTKEEWKAQREAANWMDFTPADRETDKAVMAWANISCYVTDQEVNEKFWIPKSIIKDNKMPRWFAEKKREELIARHGNYGEGRTLEVCFC